MDVDYKGVFLTIAVLGAVVGLLGVADLSNVPYAGYFSGPDNRVVKVFESSPAEAAGLTVGDVLVSIDGISVEDTNALAHRERPEIGETRRLKVDRDGQETRIKLEYGPLPGVHRTVLLLGFAIALSYFIFPLWAYRRAPSPSTLVLALFGLCFGFAFLPAPYSASYFLRSFAGSFSTTTVLIGFAFLVHFVLMVPRPRPFLDSPHAKKILYLPAALLAIFFVYLTVFTPDATPTFNRVVSSLIGVFIVGFFGWALVGMIQNFVRATAEERRRHGLHWMLVGTLVGLLPITFSNLLRTISPEAQLNLPGIRFYFLTLGLIPLTFAIAAVKSARARARD